MCDYTYWFIKEGSLVDVKGASDSFNIFHPSGHRWDICVIKEIVNNDWLIIKPIHRFQAYPFAYQKNMETKYSIASPNIQPFLSQVTRVEVSDLKDADLVDIEDMKDGKWKVAEVVAKIVDSLWIQYGDHYQSNEHKESLREWIDLPEGSSERVAKYLTHTRPLK